MNFKKFKNRYFPNRRRWRNWRYWIAPIQVALENRKPWPQTQNAIEQLSKQYLKDWRFEREKKLMEYALQRFPDWEYAQKRLEWHARPAFHPDPNKSKVVPRTIIYQPRNPEFIPKPETMASLCIVTGMSSNAPYFELGFQLIESIKATRFYKDVPIKILDCGLTPKDIATLHEYFDVEIKDPGWDVDPSLIDQESCYHRIPLNGWKGCTARPYIHQHFPGYEYYLWIDADTWIKDDIELDKLLHLTTSQGVGCYSESHRKPIHRHKFSRSLDQKSKPYLQGKRMSFNGVFCSSITFLEFYRVISEINIRNKNKYLWGADMATFHLTITKHIDSFIDAGCRIELKRQSSEPVVSLIGHRKINPYPFGYAYRKYIEMVE